MAEKNHRLCVSCRKTAHKDELWRIVRTFPNYDIQLDEGMGRSAYLCPQMTCLQAAKKKNRLGRVLRSPIPAQIFQTLENRLHNPPNSLPESPPESLSGQPVEKTAHKPTPKEHTTHQN